MKILENASSILHRSIVANEIAKRLTGKTIAIEVMRSEESHFASMLIETMRDGRIRTPSENAIFALDGPNHRIVDFKVEI